MPRAGGTPQVLFTAPANKQLGIQLAMDDTNIYVDLRSRAADGSPFVDIEEIYAISKATGAGTSVYTTQDSQVFLDDLTVVGSNVVWSEAHRHAVTDQDVTMVIRSAPAGATLNATDFASVPAPFAKSDGLSLVTVSGVVLFSYLSDSILGIDAGPEKSGIYSIAPSGTPTSISADLAVYMVAAPSAAYYLGTGITKIPAAASGLGSLTRVVPAGATVSTAPMALGVSPSGQLHYVIGSSVYRL
jgi:hypothetical protein